MEIKASMVKELRDKTGAGMMDAKKALVEANGDMTKAQEILRQKGVASADKKMGRIAAEGLIYSIVDAGVGAMVEVNCETDFVAKNEDFIELTKLVTQCVIENDPQSIDDIITSVGTHGEVMEDYIKDKIAKIGEKITIRRFVRYDAECCVNTYIHNGKIGVLLETACVDGTDKCEHMQLAKDICLHIASNAPEFISRIEIPSSVIDDEKRIEMGKEDLANKPVEIREKIVEGRVNKLMAQKCLLEQPFVKNPDMTIEKLIEGKAKIVRFARYALGEGLEKREDNFAEEVMNQIKG